MVIATQLQSGGEGTYPLTDVQVDRFMLRLFSGYSSLEEEEQVLNNIDIIDSHDIRQSQQLQKSGKFRHKPGKCMSRRWSINILLPL